MSAVPRSNSSTESPVPVSDSAVITQIMAEELVTLYQAGAHYFTHADPDAALVEWLEDVSESAPERRLAALELLALYGTSAFDTSLDPAAPTLTLEERNEFAAMFASSSPHGVELERAATDAVDFLLSCPHPGQGLPAEWATYATCRPQVFITVAMVLAIMMLEAIRTSAMKHDAAPEGLWNTWLLSHAKNRIA